MSWKLLIFILLLSMFATGIGAYGQRNRVYDPKPYDPTNGFYYEFSGYGTASAYDASTADSAASVQAQNNAVNMCRGYAYNFVTISNVCNTTQDSEGNTVYSCNVGVSLTCWVIIR